MGTVKLTKKETTGVKAQPPRLFRGEEPSLWSPYQDGVSQSLVGCFRECREATRLKFVEGWTPMSNSLAIEFGSCFHWALSQAYAKKKLPGAAFLKTVLEDYHKVWLGTMNPPITTAQQERQAQAYELARAVLPAYLNRWEGDWTGSYKLGNTTVKPVKWTGLEQEFRIPCELPDGRTVILRGMRDGVFECHKGKTWLLETKTKALVDEEGIADILQVNFQVWLYLYSIFLETHDLPKGVLYNVIRRPGLRQGVKEDTFQFMHRVQDDIEKRPDHYFIRWQMDVTKKELMHWVRAVLHPTLQDLCNWYDGSAPHYMNDNALMAKYGRSDMFKPIVLGRYEGLFKRQAAFNELSDFEQV